MAAHVAKLDLLCASIWESVGGGGGGFQMIPLDDSRI